jgi:hypothetical protein
VTYCRSVVFSGYYGISIDKTDCHDIAEILLKVALTLNLHLVRKDVNVNEHERLSFTSASHHEMDH